MINSKWQFSQDRDVDSLFVWCFFVCQNSKTTKHGNSVILFQFVSIWCLVDKHILMQLLGWLALVRRFEIQILPHIFQR